MRLPAKLTCVLTGTVATVVVMTTSFINADLLLSAPYSWINNPAIPEHFL